MSFKTSAVYAFVALCTSGAAASLAAQSPTEFFETRVRPVLADKCQSCHGRLARGGLRLNSRDAILEGGDSGPAIVPGDPDGSLLIASVRHEIEGLEMPRDEDPLSPREIEGLAEWIAMDAPWPAEATSLAVADEGLSPSAQIFVDRVQPLLSQKCFSCHTDRERGGLRLDSRDRMLAGGGRGPAIIPGNPEQSVLISAIRHASPDLQMPQNAEKLSDREIEGVIEWIRSGAEWAEATAPMTLPRRVITDEERAFWSFREIESPTVPAAGSWGSTEIDRFVLAALEERGLEPVGPADRRQLIRRATFDLTGLPPTPEDVEAFVADTATDAFAKVVDRLLASPQYGERWGRHWLDVIRFGEDDTRGLALDGSGKERYPSAYVQRDWVIGAFNDDMPYDDFVKAQLAGDLLPADKRDKAIGGLGFLGGGPWYYDLADPPVARADERHDRVDVTSRGFLGLTVGCARCHDHKYDPIGTHDYYAMAGVFNNTDYREYPIADSAAAAAYENDKQFIEDLQEGLDDYLGVESEQLARVLSLQISKYMMGAFQVTVEEIPIEVAANRGKLDLETLERWVRFLAKEPKHYPFVVDWQEMAASEDPQEEDARQLADSFQRLVLEIVADQDSLEVRNERIIAKGSDLDDVKSTPMPNGFESFFDEHQLELDTMERERFNLYTDIFIFDLDNKIGDEFTVPGLLRFYGWSLERQLGRVASDHVAATRAEIERRREALPDIGFAMGVRDKEDEDLVDLGLHIRGDPRNLGEKVPRSFLHVLAPETPDRWTAGSGRLALAEAIAAHPITARVIVNRVWRWHMGSGIVETPSNFGFAGDRPSNPALLEHLATRFVDGGMSIKQLHRDIMLSSVYQLGTSSHPANEAVDGDNRFYWRANSSRLDAESIRDAMLMASGDLDPKVGGKSLSLDDPRNDRRTVYGSVSRFQVNEYLQIFDFPNPSLTAEKRYPTNVPLQSLYFMNSDFVHRQAGLLVRRLARETTTADSTASGAEADVAGGETPSEGDAAASEGEEAPDNSVADTFDDRVMIERAYPLLYGRTVTESELRVGLEFLEEQRAALLAEELAKLAEAGAQDEADGSAPGADDTDPKVEAERSAKMKAWIQYARALFSAAEFRYVD
jgi:mono/diheme cytochrome c family protein